MFSAEMIVGIPPEDARLIADFFQRLDAAMQVMAEDDAWPLAVFQPQEIVEGKVRLSRAITVRDEEFEPHPKYFLDGKVKHIKWAALLSRMYPGGVSEPPVVEGNVQGHPDYVTPDGLVVEIKTCAGGRWQFFKRKPLGIHVEQIKGYLWMTRAQAGLLVYENRETLDVWVHVIRLREGEDPLAPFRGEGERGA